MTVVTWRLHRAQLIVAGVIAAIAGIGLVLTGSATQQITPTVWRAIEIVTLEIFPALLGAVTGATLVGREISLGTHRWAWSQGVSRTRWLLSASATIGIIGVLIVGALTLVASWWVEPVKLGPRIAPQAFSFTGIVPLAYFLFALTLGIAGGALLKTPAPGALVAILGYAISRVVVQNDVRDRLAPTRHLAIARVPFFDLAPIWSTAPPPSAVLRGWVLNVGYVPMGRLSPLPGRDWSSTFPGASHCSVHVGSPVTAAMQAHCAALLGYHGAVAFQPASNYWMLQAGETGIFLAGSVLLLIIGARLVRRHSD